MNNKRHPVKQAVKHYYAEKSLSEAQLYVLQKQLKRATRNKFTYPGVIKWVGSLAASLVFFSIFFGYLQTPAVIGNAYADIKKDAEIYNGLQPSIVQWMNKNHIAAVPRQYPVEMSKFCQLDQYLTAHVRVAGVKQGNMHLFFHRGKVPLSWINRSGVLDRMNWKLLKVRDNLILIVLYSHDMREKAVQYILGEILPELHV